MPYHFQNDRAEIEGRKIEPRMPKLPKATRALRSWYCEPCAVEVYQLRCPHCGKSKRERR